ncbi:MAG: hypothetical protein H6735_25635 [Alphaproteobacteria bacterium]|nr:hypothetical protein [Alphaproteobacteria bacterium]
MPARPTKDCSSVRRNCSWLCAIDRWYAAWASTVARWASWKARTQGSTGKAGISGLDITTPALGEWVAATGTGTGFSTIFSTTFSTTWICGGPA